ncbi:unnamed protein product [Peniophora sp. CBMAI 1063]|nr:unnamed protein product [Peniophora sp. CBMAI 1063]
MSLRRDPALLLHAHLYASGLHTSATNKANNRVRGSMEEDLAGLFRCRDCFGERTRDRRPRQGDLIAVKNDFGEKWLAVINRIIFIEVNGIDSIPAWSVGHLREAIADGKVRNADILEQQLRGMPSDWHFVAVNHTDTVYADDQLISGVTKGDMYRLGYLDPEFYLLINDVDGTDVNDPLREREYVLASRLDISAVLAY